jgi:hypothetical protein
VRPYAKPPMRTASILLATALVCSPSLAFAHGGHGKGKDHHHGGGGGGGGGDDGPAATVKGAGQRLTFTFGGELTVKNGKAHGEFALVAHPIAPGGNTLNASCHYKMFSDVTIAGDTATFTAKGKCRRIMTDGEIESVEATNTFQIVDRPSGDAISVSFVGSGGIAVPSGALEFGGFTITPA